ncbi:DNA polymerase III subunit gamma/tau [Mycoplasma sp. 3686d]|uniref:DNA polymerase III subunit gamma/tau n=1 Tax=Mycoplasma sp. 3686d TaxID=2967300 RepID=UPI00211B7901|nr:DNA polymerase III subunit gamma/tau [Mycoplasma sp. 3686d]UUM24702.1 DNA polymerase III subunit gamma/tau [Mycoplasma sp. 3686d]
MSYKALYRKYRPTSFEQVVGQEHIINTLKNIILTRKIGHAYLFSGPKGSGKTSLANIFANVLNCMHGEDLTVACDTCKGQIGKSLDIIEMDAASNNGVDEIRDLKEKIEQSPIHSRFKIYIIDEVHMLTKSAFNALLKTLEEPPAHAIFIFATTDHQKIPLTIISRLQRFNFTKLTNEQIYQHLIKVLNQERIAYSNEAIKLIARLSSGAMRDALSIADQSASFGEGKITVENLTTNFGIVSNDLIIQLINLIYTSKTKKTLKLFYFLKESGSDPNQLVISLLNIIKEWMIYNLTHSSDLLEWTEIEQINSLQINQKFALSFLDELNEVLIKMARSEYPFELLEVLILKMCAYHVNVQVPEPAQVIKPIIEQPLGSTYVYQNTRANVPIQEPELPDEVHDWGDLIHKQTEEINLPKSSLNYEQKEQNINLNNDLVQTKNQNIYQNSPKENQVEYEQFSSDSETKLIDLSDNEGQKINIINKYEEKWNDQEIANLLHILQQGMQKNTKDSFTSFKKMSEKMILASEPLKYEKMKLLEQTKILASSDTYILITSDNENVLNQIHQIRNTEDFQKYINTIFSGYKHIYVTSKDQRKRALNLYRDQFIRGIIPSDLKPIEPLTQLENRFKDQSTENQIKSIFGSAVNLMKRGKNE